MLDIVYLTEGAAQAAPDIPLYGIVPHFRGSPARSVHFAEFALKISRLAQIQIARCGRNLLRLLGFSGGKYR
jgi:hypothetical protein